MPTSDPYLMDKPVMKQMPNSDIIEQSTEIAQLMTQLQQDGQKFNSKITKEEFILNQEFAENKLR